MPEPEGKIRVRLGIDPDTHKDLRVLAAECGLSMSQYCEAVVLEAVRKRKKVKAERSER